MTEMGAMLLVVGRHCENVITSESGHRQGPTLLGIVACSVSIQGLGHEHVCDEVFKHRACVASLPVSWLVKEALANKAIYRSVVSFIQMLHC